MDRTTSLKRLRDEAGGVVETGESVYDWINRNTANGADPATTGGPGDSPVIINADRVSAIVAVPEAAVPIPPPVNAPAAAGVPTSFPPFEADGSV